MKLKRYESPKERETRWMIACVMTLLAASAGVAATREVSNVTELTNAIAQAANGDTINLAAGTYDLSTLEEFASGTSWGTMSTPDTSAGTSCIWFNKKLIFKGADDTPWHEKTADQETILDGGNVAGIIYPYTGDGRKSTFQNITFRNGSAKNGGKNHGGGIYSLGPDPVVSNCVFRGCTGNSGGGTYNCSVYDSFFENCAATNGSGGGAFGTGDRNYKNIPTNSFVRCVFAGCSASNSGGGVYHYQCGEFGGKNAGVVEGCVFSNCTAAAYGGAICEKDPGLVTNCVFVGNSAEQGGAAYSCELVVDCHFTNNTSTSHGGAMLNFGTACSCTFSGNNSARYGGAIYDGNDSSIVTNCVFVENKALTAGAVYKCKSLVDCHFTNNVATTSYGGAVRSVDTIQSCTFSGNIASSFGGALYDCSASNCVFDANVSTNKGGACHSVDAVDCVFTGNRSVTQRGGAMFECTAVRCAFTNNYCTYSGRGAACAFTDATDCTFSGVGDVSCGSYTRCVFDGVTSNQEQIWVLDSLINAGGSIYATNCLIINCSVKYLINNEGNTSEAVNCTFADNTIAAGGCAVRCSRGMYYSMNKYYPSTNIVVNCLFSGNKFADGDDADFILSKTTAETDFGYCSLQLRNCLYTAGVASLDLADVAENIFVGKARFVAGHEKYPDAPYYSLRYLSPAKNKGENADWMSSAVDFAGNPRINDGTVDIGCYECILDPLGFSISIR